MRPYNTSFKQNNRYKHSLAPEGLMVLKGSKHREIKGSHWMVADENGFSQISYLLDEKAIKSNSVYIENFEIKKELRGLGYGRELYRKVEQFTRNLGAEWIQIDSYLDVVGFWEKMGYVKIKGLHKGSRIPMIKKLQKNKKK